MGKTRRWQPPPSSPPSHIHLPILSVNCVLFSNKHTDTHTHTVAGAREIICWMQTRRSRSKQSNLLHLHNPSSSLDNRSRELAAAAVLLQLTGDSTRKRRQQQLLQSTTPAPAASAVTPTAASAQVLTIHLSPSLPFSFLTLSLSHSLSPFDCMRLSS